MLGTFHPLWEAIGLLEVFIQELRQSDILRRKPSRRFIKLRFASIGKQIIGRSFKSLHLRETHDIRFELIEKVVPLAFSLRWAHVCISPFAFSPGSFASDIYSFRRCPALDVEFVSFWGYFSYGIVKAVEVYVYCWLGGLDYHWAIEVIFDVCSIKDLLLDTVCTSLLLFVVSRGDESVIIVLTRFGIVKKVGYTYDIALHLDIILRLRQTLPSRIEVIWYWVLLTLSLFLLVL